jgi:hypothetical protein
MLAPHKYANDLLRLGHFDTNNPSTEFDIFKGKSFLQFNELIGLPVKLGKEHPIYDYELDIVKAIEEHNNIWIKKARGIGVTELILRYLTWKIVSTNELDNKKIMLVSGTFVQHAHDVKVRMENLFRRKFPLLQLESKFTDLIIKSTDVKIFPSRNVKDLRGYDNVAFLFIDEADMFDQSVNDELLHAIIAYEEKSGAKTIMVSTPNRPGRLFESIERDPNSKYHKMVLTYEVGLDKIFDRAEILKKRNEPEFGREYCGLYLGKVGNTFSSYMVDRCVKLAEQYKNTPTNNFVSHSLGLDPAFGSGSRTALVLVEHLEEFDKIIVRYSKEFEVYPTPAEIVSEVFRICRETPNTWVYVDGSARSLIAELKIAFNENINYKNTEDVPLHNNRIIPINFMKENKKLLQNLYSLVSNEYLCIPQSMEKVIISLKSAVSKENSLDKTQSSYNDTLDALRLACRPFHFD